MLISWGNIFAKYVIEIFFLFGWREIISYNYKKTQHLLGFLFIR
ncbi:hypothetical protein GAPWK_0293 [Gilliamella apicola]|nr:hypothetical protein GAPWK_0293 [Gilliamella apicola]